MPEKQVEVATLGGGCFWCLETVFGRLRGVEQVVSGYAGGDVPNPSYHQVCTGTTGHAEVVQVTFDPKVISFRDLLDVFFTIHNPTTLNRQGADVGPQYRSVIFFHAPEQRETAKAVIDKLRQSGTYDSPIVTELSPLECFYPAEEEHHRYYERHPEQAYCQVVITPKVTKLRERHFDKLNDARKSEESVS